MTTILELAGLVGNTALIGAVLVAMVALCERLMPRGSAAARLPGDDRGRLTK